MFACSQPKAIAPHFHEKKKETKMLLVMASRPEAVTAAGSWLRFHSTGALETNFSSQAHCFCSFFLKSNLNIVKEDINLGTNTKQKGISLKDLGKNENIDPGYHQVVQFSSTTWNTW